MSLSDITDERRSQPRALPTTDFELFNDIPLMESAIEEQEEVTEEQAAAQSEPPKSPEFIPSPEHSSSPEREVFSPELEEQQEVEAINPVSLLGDSPMPGVEKLPAIVEEDQVSPAPGSKAASPVQPEPTTKTPATPPAGKRKKPIYFKIRKPSLALPTN